MHRFKQDILNYGMLNNMLIHFKSSSTEDWLGHDSGSLEIRGITCLLHPSSLSTKVHALTEKKRKKRITDKHA